MVLNVLMSRVDAQAVDSLESAKRIKKEMWMKRSSFLGLEEYTNGNASYEHGKSDKITFINCEPSHTRCVSVYLTFVVFIMCYRFGKLEVEAARFNVVSGRGTSTGKIVVQPEQTRTATTRHHQG